MCLLLHLNGPSGVGKSTLARRYADDHPGVLDLDIDRIVALIGGWEDDFGGTLRPARRLALTMAATHLSDGHDVVVPQLVTSHEEVRRFEEAADRAGARYLEVVLEVDVEEQVRRFRAKSQDSERDLRIEAYLDSVGGEQVLRRIHGHLADYAAERPDAVRLDTSGDEVHHTYARLLDALP